MAAIERRKLSLTGLLLAIIGLSMVAEYTFAATVCTNTDFPGSGKSDVRSYREMAGIYLNQEIQAGEQAERSGALALAWRHYNTARLRFYHPDLGLWANVRCAPESDYRRALRHQQGVGSKLAQRDLADGKYLWSEGDKQQLIKDMALDNPQAMMLLGGGGLEYYLRSFRYQDFEEQFQPFVAGLYGNAGAADGFRKILLLLKANRADLEQLAEQKKSQQILEEQRESSGIRLADDTLGLLPEEAAGFAELDAARDLVVKEIERNIAYWLDREREDFTAVESAKNMMAEMMTADAAIDKLKAAADFPSLINEAGAYKEEPWYSLSADYKQQILARAEQHGDKLMGQGSPHAAKKYFSFAGAREKRDAASALGRKQGDELTSKMEQQVKDGGSMFDAATDEEREKFDSDTDALADELGL